MGKYDFGFDSFEDSTLAWIAGEIPNGSRVLEFGAANGRLTKYLSVQKDCGVDIVEIDQESGSEAAAYAGRALLGAREGDIENYRWLELGRHYDHIVFADVLEHLAHPKEVLLRCSAVLKDRGRILVSVPNIAHNSIIIELINGRFDYRETGLLDDTHLHFFTRGSFIKMAGQAGWAVIAEKAKHIRVGENEIPNSYQDVPKEVFKELAARDGGDAYQYMFTLASSEEYLMGQWGRQVCMDAYSYYYAEALYENNGAFDYKKSARRCINPAQGTVEIRLPVPGRSESAKIYPINCNCIFRMQEFWVETVEGRREVDAFSHNGEALGKDHCFFHENPCIELMLGEKDRTLVLGFHIYKYDFSDAFLDGLYGNLKEKERRIKEICEDYEAEIGKLAEQNQKLQEGYEAEIGRLAEQSQKLQEGYEAEISRLAGQNRELQESHEAGIQKVCEGYEAEIRRLTAQKENGKEYMASGMGLARKAFRRLPIPEGIKNKMRIRYHLMKGAKRPDVVSIYGENECHPKVKGRRKEITAVIPNYNYARYLNERIDSILFQTYPVREIIILDDCSTDNSIPLIEGRIKYNRSGIPIRLVRNEKNSGSVFSQWQKAFQEATTEFVWIAEADDSSDARFLETVMRGFEDEEVVISYCESLTMDESNVLLMGDLREWIDIFSCGKWDRDYVRDGVQEVSETMCINNTIANVSGAVIKNGDYGEILEGAKNFRLAGDWYFYMNLLKRGKIAYFRESLNYHRMQTQGVTLSIAGRQEFEEIIRLQDFAMENFDISDEVVKKIYIRRERKKADLGL